MNLDKRITQTLDYCNERNFDYDKQQLFLTDALNRCLINNKTKLIDCIRKFNASEDYQNYYKFLLEKNNLDKISGTNRLLLIKCIVCQ